MASAEYVVITKTCVGDLRLSIVNPLTGVVSRIMLRSNEPKRMLPVSTAALIYTDIYSGAYRMYKQGYFTFDDPDKVYKYALEHDLVIGDPDLIAQTTSASYLDDIKKAVLSDNRAAIDKYLDTDKHRSDLAAVARENVGKIRQSTLRYLEGKLGVALTIDGESVE